MSFWHSRNVFVTGATGLLGSWMVEELLLLALRKTPPVELRQIVPNNKRVVKARAPN